MTEKQNPPDGTLRLVDDKGQPSDTNSGRLEMWMSGDWGSVCN